MHQNIELIRTKSMNQKSGNPVRNLLYGNEIPAGLDKKIFLLISAKEKALARRRFAVFAAASSLSVISLIPATIYGIGEISHSGILQYLSLFLSDWKEAISSWKEISSLIAESFPAMGILVPLTAVFAAFAFLREAGKNALSAYFSPKTV